MKRKMRIALAGVTLVGALAALAAPASAYPVTGDWDGDGRDGVIATSLKVEVEVREGANNLRQMSLAL